MGEIRIVGPGKTRGYPYPVFKKIAENTVDALCLSNFLLTRQMLVHEKT